MKVIIFALLLFVSLKYVRLDEDYDIVDYTRVIKDDCPNGAPYCEDSDKSAKKNKKKGLSQKNGRQCIGSNCK
uniref:Uncharacterized protein n=1 Tax=Trichobilharzia regenti TaxID=157069 RepID=A0AA85JIW8_TRIRE|nr:unnamed protein product [Trichobilharzia regenti]